MKKKRKWLPVTIIVILLAGGGGGYWAYKHFQPVAQTTSLITTRVTKGDIRQEITATGTVNYPEMIPLSFKQEGTIARIYVEVGDKVEAGQPIAQMDLESLERDLADKEAALQNAEIQYNQDLIQQEAAVKKAEQAVQEAEKKADPAYLANQVYIAELGMNNASNTLAKAQQNGDSSVIQQAQNSLVQAQSNMEEAKEMQSSGAAEAVESAKLDLTVQQVKLDQLNARTSITQAQTALDNARTNLANATLVAPAKGLVTSVEVTEGKSVNSSTEIINVAVGGDIFQINSTVAQSEITQIKAGQKVEITLDSNPDQTMNAEVSEVALQGNTTQGVTTFSVSMLMDQPYDLLRSGMGVNVSIIVDEVTDVLIVPSQAVSEVGGQKGVYVVVTDNDLTVSSPDSVGTDQTSRQNGEQSGQQGTATLPGGGGFDSQRENGSTAQGDNASPAPGNGSSTQQENSSSDTPGSGFPRNGGSGGNSYYPGMRNQTSGNSSSSGFSNRGGENGNTSSLQTRFVPVEVGLDDGVNVEIKSGLTEGQEIVSGTRTVNTSTESSSTNNRNNNNLSIPGLGGGIPSGGGMPGGGGMGR